MRKFAICLLAVLTAAATAACGGGKDNDGSVSSAVSSEASSASSAVSSELSSAGSEASSGVSGDTGVSGDAVSLVIKDETLKKAFDAVKAEFGEMYITAPAVITEQQMQEMYYVSPDDIDEFAGEMSMMNVSGDTLVGVKAKPGKAAAVAEALEKRRGDIVDQFKQYPVNFMDLKSEAAQVVTEGDYVFLVLMGDINVPDGEDASLKMAQDEVDRAVKAIRSAFSK